MKPYTNQGAVDCGAEFDSSSVKGKTAVVTGGANGIGEGYVHALTKAGAFVVIADLDVEEGLRLEKELGNAVKFVKCNVTVWADQLAVFKTAISSSPSRRVDIVIANAGISGADSVFFNNTEAEEPEEPKLNVINVNLVGVMYTIKLALHYFRRQNALNKGEPLDQVLILQGSLAGYLDLAGVVQYASAKYGLRGVMRALRRSEWQHNIRVAYIAPWFIHTKILSEAVVEFLAKANVEYAKVEDAAAAVMRIVSDPGITGRSFAILPRSMTPHGYVDIDFDDYQEGTFLGDLQLLAAGGSHRASVSGAVDRKASEMNE
ncbi:uncharacterized protein Z518_02209 [Rhinocladiella mackenziei CBS 650.93]|uniref:5'-hydroxyaverantin dehydrogenase n=1 Tax=Rhinocladiella mackenziei CBS 650.93 TaxID=1442369 RepID=A0A0D2IWA9_9EURO|nr:uncharacterized protein Z518_02209 [Rhinocladiella mackenziei CBS 650.93]KIX07556.1 hypothetical protein Z518_02209 [Rhinocladiella mackenziei CBS 650.93]